MRRYDDDSKSAVSHKSTQSSRSSVLERAREYNRRIDEEKATQQRSSSRSNSRHRSSSNNNNNRNMTHERAKASVSRENDYGPQRPPPVMAAVAPAPPRTNERMAMEPAPKPHPQQHQQQQQQQQALQPQEAVVSPELLVDALSGHEDGLLAIAEKLMEHYDAGYDVMGEAIIDAFADVQKLFQHVVEAAHMEGAAFEASRRQAEQAADTSYDQPPQPPDNAPVGAPSRHDEFIDEDVKELLSQAIRTGAPLREANKHLECFKLYESACVSASALLPVDSDHRGRLQLSIARAESMSEDRACAILRYAMDDVLRSGLRATKLPDPSKRSDMVLTRPRDLPSVGTNQQLVVQSSEEALASLVEEMKEIISAPVYENTPLRDVAQRFWNALAEDQKSHAKNEERLEQSLGKLKGEFLLARAEWEEKLTSSQESADHFKRKYMLLKDNKGDAYLEQARSLKWKMEKRDAEEDFTNTSMNSSRSVGPTGSVASIGSGLAQSARTIVGSFNCTGPNERSGVVVNSELNGTDRQQYVVPNSAAPTPQQSNAYNHNVRRGRSSTRREVHTVSSANHNRMDF